MSISAWFTGNTATGYIALSDDNDRNRINTRKRNLALAAAIAVGVVIITVGMFHDYRWHDGIYRPLPGRGRHGGIHHGGSHHGGISNLWSKQLLLSFDDNSDIGKPAHGSQKVEDVFQVYAPPEDIGELVLNKTLIDNYVFDNSYGKPFVVSYTAPDQEFTHVRLTLNATTYGRQFDRLAQVYLGGSEIWRTSTAEPGHRNISFSYVKDVSKYASLFKTSDIDFTFALNNIVDEVYTGPITVSLSAQYFNVPETRSTSVAELLKKDVTSPDQVIAIAPPTGLSWSAPSQKISTKLPALPKDAARVVVDVFASGNADEEFWYSHLLDPYSDWFPNGANEFGKHGPTRLVEVHINGVLAGVAIPFPVIYTGGYSPPLWSKIVGTNTYDVPSYQIDITPFLPYLWSESGSAISLRVVNGDKSESAKTLISEDWIVSANVLVWQVPGVQGSGVSDIPKNKDSLTRIVSPRYDSRVSQIIAFSDSISTSARLEYIGTDGEKEDLTVGWQQKLALSNVQSVSNGGDKHEIVFSSSTANKLVVDDDFEAVNAQFKESHGLVLNLKYDSFEDSFKISYVRGVSTNDALGLTSAGQNGTSAFAFTGPRQVSGHGDLETNYTRQSYITDEKYHRHVRAANGSVLFDHVDCSKPGLYSVDSVSPIESLIQLDGLDLSFFASNE
ncbi:Peptide-N4-(N-acetyl-beta-glucosaminyl)asparagineamidase A [Sugiyamaella lignohabitans]|uniref:Peptide-N4-(N-acetyl-beta-glucosaminyl)asparagineamidase A n=1 Tax=Sugiyamaella lignohabitans TaxID=796027 RepID=A0A167C0A3_9ASCO|nr:Peptide-N4-(N-acetyl-beta-glucosaminyl)asparagineamidase A [Sugiyamaella lignohabitans]ANB11054.1 Peptide-N4-(N-acetyl-beta-glucosaminyl)asparagineamidase A [Sugiyamaella lignohabitans]